MSSTRHRIIARITRAASVDDNIPGDNRQRQRLWRRLDNISGDNRQPASWRQLRLWRSCGRRLELALLPVGDLGGGSRGCPGHGVCAHRRLRSSVSTLRLGMADSSDRGLLLATERLPAKEQRQPRLGGHKGHFVALRIHAAGDAWMDRVGEWLGRENRRAAAPGRPQRGHCARASTRCASPLGVHTTARA